jgi:hypothetical protein
MDSSSLMPNSLGSVSLPRRKRKKTDPLPWEKTDPLPSLMSPPSLSCPSSSAPWHYSLKLNGNKSILLPYPIVDKWKTTLGPVATNMARRTEDPWHGGGLLAHTARHVLPVCGQRGL